ncbi:MAG: hypothetical protein N2F24_12770 [Deltaproteobacteria bacterium]
MMNQIYKPPIFHLIRLLLPMTPYKKCEIFGESEHKEERGFEWMFKKARELGFSEREVDRLRTVYNYKKQTGGEYSK